MTTPRNARFWTCVNAGLVKITLRPGQTLRHCQGGPTDEGWSRHAITWTYEDDAVKRVIVDEGRDCDGHTSNVWEEYCAIDRLNLGSEPYGLGDCQGIHYPDWEELDHYCRDQYAELAGY
jgi:hypothetical protein